MVGLGAPTLGTRVLEREIVRQFIYLFIYKSIAKKKKQQDNECIKKN